MAGPELAPCSSDAILQRLLDGWAGVQGAEDMDGRNGPARQFRGHVVGDAGEAQHLDVKHFAGRLRGLEVQARVLAQAQIELVARNGFAHHVMMTFELVADGRSDEVGAVGIEPVLHQKIDMAEVDKPEVDGDLLAVGRLGPKLLHVSCHDRPSLDHLYGWYLEGRPGEFKGCSEPHRKIAAQSSPVGLRIVASLVLHGGARGASADGEAQPRNFDLPFWLSASLDRFTDRDRHIASCGAKR